MSESDGLVRVVFATVVVESGYLNFFIIIVLDQVMTNYYVVTYVQIL